MDPRARILYGNVYAANRCIFCQELISIVLCKILMKKNELRKTNSKLENAVMWFRYIVCCVHVDSCDNHLFHLAKIASFSISN
jgi:hypothetical protein